MKKLFYCLLIVVSVFASCAPDMMPSSSPENSVAIKIECRNENILKQTVLQYLRLAKAKDINVGNHGEDLDIQAGIRLQDTPLYKIESMKSDLQQIPGVVFVGVEINKTIVKQAF